MAEITVEVRGDKAVQAKLERLGMSLYELEPEMAEIGRGFKTYYSTDVFISRGSAIGHNWPPLAASTLASKSGGPVGGSTAEPLVRTGHMRDSFAYEAAPSQVRVYNEVSNETVPYFIYHQMGTSRMPQRMMIGVSESLKRMAKEIIAIGVRRKIDGV